MTTNWSAVRRAVDSRAPDGMDALESLCRVYWQPLYAYVRRRGYGPDDSRDLTQSFFADLLARDAIAVADASRGRFRTFLLSSMSNHLSKERERVTAAKRGGGAVALSWDLNDGEDYYQMEASDELAPERHFDRRWAQELSRNALERLKVETEGEGGAGRFDVLEKFLLNEPEAGDYERCAAGLGIGVGGVKTAVRRLRMRFGVILRDEVARTVSESMEIDDELNHLIQVLAGN